MKLKRKNVKEVRAHHETLPMAYGYSWKVNKDAESVEEDYSLAKHHNVFKFDDLQWTLIYITRKEDNYPIEWNARAYISFDNGFYVSILNGLYSIGDVDEYELAIMDKDGICYDTPLSDDVVGGLTKEDVEKWLKDVSELPYDMHWPKMTDVDYDPEQYYI